MRDTLTGQATFAPSPGARGLAALFAFLGTFLAHNLLIVASGYIFLLVPLLISSRLLKIHFKFLLIGIAPLTIGLLLLWGGIVRAGPGMEHGSSVVQGVSYALTASIRLAIFAALFQLCFLSLPFSELIHHLEKWGLRNDTRILFAVAFTVWPEFKLRARQIVTARYARGLAKDRSMMVRIRQFPFLLRPLLTWAIYTAVHRSEIWQQQGLLDRATHTDNTSFKSSRISSIVFLSLSLGWLTLNIFSRFK